jgi:hypothetical protein
MANIKRNFVAGRMNKVVDERLVPDGEYIDAMNIRMGSTENSEVGVIENTKGNTPLTSLAYIDGTPLSPQAKCIGAIEDSANETIYWFVHDGNFGGTTGVLDMIVSFNTYSNVLTYHIISVNDGSDNTSTLNFSQEYLITGVNIVEDLIFFTDDYNPPRVFNKKRNYPNPVAGIDQFTAESILVIKRPPAESPSIELVNIGGQSNYMDTRFLSFAYRYRYADGEYSATSQWSEIAFIPKPFSFSVDSFLNEGMTNFYNAVNVTYNSGSSLVVGIDLLFKQADNNIIKVIEKLDKNNLGLINDTNYTYQFSNSKIFTILPESELLRLYDNVPRYAKAQTIMGNRLMYGNYVEGYDLIDSSGRPIKLEYSLSLTSEEIGSENIPTAFDDSTYTIDAIEGSYTATNSVLNIDLSNVSDSLVEGSAISIEVAIGHSAFTGETPFPTETTATTQLNFSFFLQNSYASVYDMATSTEFQDAIGTSLNIQTVADSCNGFTFTDYLNCAIPNNLDSLQKFASGISAVNQPVEIITSPGSSTIGIRLIVMQYLDNIVTPTQEVFEYYEYTFAQATFQRIASTQSLHSNRGYEVGIVYMDDFNRATTTLVSPNNTMHIGCNLSAFKNTLQVTIPPTQVAPYWAKRYKLVIKPDQQGYETIYCNLFFTNPNTNECYLLLEGENIKKVEVGDRLIVKADTSGPTQDCVYATVLEKESKASGFIEPLSGAVVPSGVYIKVNPNSFSVVETENAIVAPGRMQVDENTPGSYPFMNYPMSIYRGAGYDPIHPTWEYEDYTIPAGSRIKIYLKFQRTGVSDGGCERREYTLEKTLVSGASYDNMYDWFVGDAVENILNSGIQIVGGSGCPIDNVFISGLGTIPSGSLCTNYYRFNRNSITNQLYLRMSGTLRCGGWLEVRKRRSTIIADIEVFRAENTLIFETEPTDSLPDVFFENNLSFAIDENGNHMGNVTNQNINSGISGVVDTGFFNCFSFGNGAESYKIRDSLIGKSFSLGERVTSVSAQDYKEADRFADITYSGIYNAESNVNKLNEFNLGLLDYKNLETSFGSIFILDGRQTDVLVLQEDKISYVLAGKNLLSDAAAGGAITSVPEVLGTQIARTEKYGISFNPESYIQWGFDRYFTDAKRGVVLQLRGDSYSSDQLKIVSEQGMRTWFRDMFNESFSTQKLGGYDPYMNEYVLCSNDSPIPITPECLSCGMSQSFTISTEISGESGIDYCVNLGQLIGQSTVTYNVISNVDDASFKVTATYNGHEFTSGIETESGSFTFNKDLISMQEVSMNILPLTAGTVILDVTIGCPDYQELTVIEVVLTNNSESGMSIHTQYRYENDGYISPLQSNGVVFVSGTSNPLVSRYNSFTGPTGSGAFPPEGAVLTIQTDKIGSDDYNFNVSTDKFKYARTNTLYPNTSVGINGLLAVATTATPITNSGTIYSSNFTVPAESSGNILYLIWDFRKATPVTLCYSDIDSNDACCNCGD